MSRTTLRFIVMFIVATVSSAYASGSAAAPPGKVVGTYELDFFYSDEAPSSACADGSANWVNLRARVPVNTEGDALLNSGVVSVVNVIGFRYKYSRGTEIADWLTDPEDWTR